MGVETPSIWLETRGFFERAGHRFSPITLPLHSPPPHRGAFEPRRGRIAVFAKHTVAVDVTGVGNVGGVLEGVQSSPVQLKVGFDGCGVTNGLLGTLFAVGLDGQCQQV